MTHDLARANPLSTDFDPGFEIESIHIDVGLRHSVTVYQSEEDGAVVIEIDGGFHRFDEDGMDCRVYMNDQPVFDSSAPQHNVTRGG